MYNRLFTKILDSSIWLEADTTRIVWITLLAAMDEDGYAAFSCDENLARRANVPLEALQRALMILESPDQYNPNDEFEGRRIEKVQGGWLVLKAPYYKGLLSREIAREQNRLRVQKHRDKTKVMSESLPNITDSECNTAEHSRAEHKQSKAEQTDLSECEKIYQAYPRHEAKLDAIRAIKKAIQNGFEAPFLLERTLAFAKTQPHRSRFTPLPATWFNSQRFNDDPAEWIRDDEQPKTARSKPWEVMPKSKPQYGELYPT